jgi:hypothetical protein
LRAVVAGSAMTNAKLVASGCVAVLIALYVVGAVSVPPGSLRHEVQTLPLWFPIGYVTSRAHSGGMLDDV